VSVLLKIGQVHALLREEFSDLELSRIRYYEEQGLVQPQRSKKGYRLYAERDITCLREAIRMADEEFVPLRIIRLRLIDQGLLTDTTSAKVTTKQAAKAAAQRVVTMPAPTSNVVPLLRAIPSPEISTPTSAVASEEMPDTMSVSEFLSRSGVSAETLRQIVAHGLVAPGVRGRDQFLRSSDVAVAQACDVLLRTGVDVRLLGGLRRVVEREIGIVQDATATVRAGKQNTEENRRAVAATQHDISRLREALWLRERLEFFGY
jgi:DNA-binding transcriptional MerR regulator